MRQPDAARLPARPGRLSDHELVKAALDILRRVPRAELAARLGSDRRTLQRLASPAGGRVVRPDNWLRLAEALEAAALHDVRAGGLAREARRRGAP
jgi:hypothetical protein